VVTNGGNDIEGKNGLWYVSHQVVLRAIHFGKKWRRQEWPSYILVYLPVEVCPTYCI